LSAVFIDASAKQMYSVPVALKTGLNLACTTLCQLSQGLILPFYLQVTVKPLDWLECLVLEGVSQKMQLWMVCGAGN
jgi:hypothetical protein